jgi:hypothetical protein
VFAVFVLLGVMAHGAAWDPSEESSSPVAAAHQLDLSSAALFPSSVDASLPENIEAPTAILTIMREMWTASPSFRSQCARIARAHDGRVVVEIRRQPSYEFQAVSNIARKGIAWRAKVEVYLDAKLVEMIGHEFEHIVEQIDSVDLARVAKQGLDGVVIGSSHFETARAVAAGKRIAQEYLRRGKQAS